MKEFVSDFVQQAMTVAPTALVFSLTVSIAILHGLFVRVSLRSIARRSTRERVVTGLRLVHSRNRSCRVR